MTCSAFLLIAVLSSVTIGNDRSATDREWTDSTGNFSVIARYVRCDNDAVELHTQDGRTIHVPLERLSRRDQIVVRGLRANQRSGSLDGESSFPPSMTDKSSSRRGSRDATDPPSQGQNAAKVGPAEEDADSRQTLGQKVLASILWAPDQSWMPLCIHQAVHWIIALLLPLALLFRIVTFMIRAILPSVLWRPIHHSGRKAFLAVFAVYSFATAWFFCSGIWTLLQSGDWALANYGTTLLFLFMTIGLFSFTVAPVREPNYTKEEIAIRKRQQEEDELEYIRTHGITKAEAMRRAMAEWEAKERMERCKAIHEAQKKQQQLQEAEKRRRKDYEHQLARGAFWHHEHQIRGG